MTSCCHVGFSILHFSSLGGKLSISYTRCRVFISSIRNVTPPSVKLRKKSGEILPALHCCASAVDGMLVWTEKPSEAECSDMKCSSARFMCGIKGKFGFNMQAVCDHKKRFVEVWICNLASSSNYIALIRSDFYQQISWPGFMADGLTISRQRLVCTERVMTPICSVQSGKKDNFNPFSPNCGSTLSVFLASPSIVGQSCADHSQVRWE